MPTTKEYIEKFESVNSKGTDEERINFVNSIEDIDEPIDNTGRTLLMYFVNKGGSTDEDLITAIIKKSDVNKKDNNGKTALMHSMVKRDTWLSRHLYNDSNGKLDLNVEDNNGHTIIDYVPNDEMMKDLKRYAGRYNYTLPPQIFGAPGHATDAESAFNRGRNQGLDGKPMDQPYLDNLAKQGKPGENLIKTYMEGHNKGFEERNKRGGKSRKNRKMKKRTKKSRHTKKH